MFFVRLNLPSLFGRSVFCATEILLSSGLIVDYLHTMPGTARVKARPVMAALCLSGQGETDYGSLFFLLPCHWLNMKIAYDNVKGAKKIMWEDGIPCHTDEDVPITVPLVLLLNFAQVPTARAGYAMEMPWKC